MIQTGYGMSFKYPKTGTVSDVDHRLKFDAPSSPALSSSFDETFSDSRAYVSYLSSLDGHPGSPGEIGAKRINHSLECFEFEEGCESFCKKCVEKA
jgi:hypothetical protein